MKPAVPFWFGVTDLSEYIKYPHRIEGGFVLFCTQGQGVISSGIQQYPMVKNSTAVFLSGMTFYLESASDDFLVSMFSFSKELHNEVILKLPPSFTQFVNEGQVHEHPENSSSLKGVHVLTAMAKLIYEESGNLFAHVLQKNFVESYVSYILGHIHSFLQSRSTKGNRIQRLYHRFISLVYIDCHRHHDAKHYADRLCITPRYLYNITIAYANLSPKQLIDKQLTFEIKVLLNSTDMTITEIAQTLALPDQSYLCRYFKRQVGISPSVYRKMQKPL